MKIPDLLSLQIAGTFSIEIIPPKRGASAKELLTTLEQVMPYQPLWVDVTSHAADVTWKELPNGSYKRVILRKRPGTFGLCAAIRAQLGVEAVPHVLCAGFSQDETEDSLIELNFLGIDNLLVIRGDGSERIPPDSTGINIHATDLLKQISNMNRGIYLDEQPAQAGTDFCTGVACYPEKHLESPNLGFEIQILKQKQELGAKFAITQMFFDTQRFLEWHAEVRAAGITIPIIPALKIIDQCRQVTSLPRSFFISLPDELSGRLLQCRTNAEAHEVGVAWAVEQIRSLRAAGFPHVHLFLMQNPRPVMETLNRLKEG